VTTRPMNAEPKPPLSIRILKLAWRLLVGIALAGLAVWSTMAVYYSNLPTGWLRTAAAVIFVVGSVAVFVWVRPWWLARLVFLATSALVIAWFLFTPPSNNRDWQPDLSILAYADIEGNKVTVHNVRNCDYRSEMDFDVRHYDKTFDLEKLRTADLFMVYWGSPHMAHTMISFGFEGDDYLCFSIETRKERGEGYSAVKGLFRQFELIYVVADERDVVRLRTNYRKGEDAYVFRLNGSPEQVRTLFLNYLRRVNSLRQRPEWYSALTQNCTTSIRTQRAAVDRPPWDWRMLANGHGDELLYERGAIATNLPLAELKQKSHINARARAADNAPDFSRQIRQGVPGM
jgi:hypothetical protein